MADMKPQGTQAYGVESGYEHTDANIRSIVVSIVTVVVSIFVVMACMLAMFNYMNNWFDRRDSAVSAVSSQVVVPPEPRLLPSPYTDDYKDPTFKASQKAGMQKTPDVLPWDKLNAEIAVQYNEVNSYQRNADGSYRIPIARAMELESKSANGLPSAMAWQKEYPALMAGKTNGSMNLKSSEKIADQASFDNRPQWESPDESFLVESTGGTSLQAGGLSR